MPTISSSLSAESFIVGSFPKHSRLDDHYGTQPDTVVVLASAIGPYPAGMTVHDVLQDMWGRITATDYRFYTPGYFRVDAFICWNFRATATITGEQTHSFTAAAELRIGGSMTASAIIFAAGRSSSFSVAAFLIDNIC